MLNLTGETKVFKNKAGFSCTVSRVAQTYDDGSKDYENMFVPVSFRKDFEEDLRHGDKIEMIDAFPSFFLTKDGTQVLKIVVLDAEITERAEQEEEEKPAKKPASKTSAKPSTSASKPSPSKPAQSSATKSKTSYTKPSGSRKAKDDLPF